MISRFLLPLLAGAVLFAQDPSANPQSPDLKVFLNLSDSVIQGLVQLQQQKASATAGGAKSGPDPAEASTNPGDAESSPA